MALACNSKYKANKYYHYPDSKLDRKFFKMDPIAPESEPENGNNEKDEDKDKPPKKKRRVWEYSIAETHRLQLLRRLTTPAELSLDPLSPHT
ncbi:unnamed protein product [Fusarium graminearum]|uniref:Uncharacterized protein n=1 Tax=Gibberella zeae TaxID=5518 RepID=A0A4E9EBK8_GIBZA|nr:unnamed protein product [Fusarium graminearum]CAG1965009.1 unnamed protein product [Fusarium graminearum]CAG2007748.1 unnamed protein product [Fusarium graminearum]